MKRNRVLVSWCLPALWLGTLMLPTTGEQPWKFLLLCIAAFLMALWNGLRSIAVRAHLLGIAWFAAGGIVLVLNYAKLYATSGLVDGGVLREVSFPEAAYFSIVTWTTLGYGDLAPPPSIRLYAASEALLGYVYMAISIGLVINLSSLSGAKGISWEDG